jgi:hypothetical protein
MKVDQPTTSIVYALADAAAGALGDAVTLTADALVGLAFGLVRLSYRITNHPRGRW